MIGADDGLIAVRSASATASASASRRIIPRWSPRSSGHAACRDAYCACIRRYWSSTYQEPDNKKAPRQNDTTTHSPLIPSHPITIPGGPFVCVSVSSQRICPHVQFRPSLDSGPDHTQTSPDRRRRRRRRRRHFPIAADREPLQSHPPRPASRARVC